MNMYVYDNIWEKNIKETDMYLWNENKLLYKSVEGISNRNIF